MAHLMYEDRERIAELLDMGKNLSAIAQAFKVYAVFPNRDNGYTALTAIFPKSVVPLVSRFYLPPKVL